MPARRFVGALVAVVLGAALPLGACSSDDRAAEEAFCRDLKRASTELGNGLQNSRTIEVLRTNIRDAQVELADLVDQAPSDVRGDVRTLADGFKRVVATADQSRSLPDFGQRADKLAGQLPGYARADKRLNTWQREHCTADRN